MYANGVMEQQLAISNRCCEPTVCLWISYSRYEHKERTTFDLSLVVFGSKSSFHLELNINIF